MAWHVLSGWACVFWKMGLDKLSKVRAIETLYLKWEIPLFSSSWISQDGNWCPEFYFSNYCMPILLFCCKQTDLESNFGMYVTSDKLATWSLCFLFCKTGPNREQHHEVITSIMMIEQAQCLALKSSHEVFVESNRVQEWKGNYCLKNSL